MRVKTSASAHPSEACKPARARSTRSSVSSSGTSLVTVMSLLTPRKQTQPCVTHSFPCSLSSLLSAKVTHPGQRSSPGLKYTLILVFKTLWKVCPFCVDAVVRETCDRSQETLGRSAQGPPLSARSTDPAQTRDSKTESAHTRPEQVSRNTAIFLSVARSPQHTPREAETS